MLADAPQHPQVGVGVHRLGVGGGPEEPGHLRVALLVRLLGEGQVLAVGLRFPGESFLQIVGGAHINLLSTRSITSILFPDFLNIMQAEQGINHDVYHRHAWQPLFYAVQRLRYIVQPQAFQHRRLRAAALVEPPQTVVFLQHGFEIDPYAARRWRPGPAQAAP